MTACSKGIVFVGGGDEVLWKKLLMHLAAILDF